MITNLLQYHLIHRIQHQIIHRADRTAFRQWSPNGEMQLTWGEAATRIDRIAAGLLGLGVEVQERIGIFANNTMAWALTDLAILHLRGISVPLYSTNTPAQAAFVTNDADIRILFVGEQAQLDAAIALRGVCPQLRHIVVFDEGADLRGCEIAQHLSAFERAADPAAFAAQRQQRIEECDLQDLFTLIYTSGTTGEPKGVMLDYRNLAAQLYLHDERLTVGEEDVSLSFLPLSHVFERAWSFFVMHSGAQNVFPAEHRLGAGSDGAGPPDADVCGAAFLREDFQRGARKVARAPWLRRALFHWAIVCGERKFLQERAGKPLGKVFDFTHRWADKLVLSKLRGILGGRVRFCRRRAPSWTTM